MLILRGAKVVDGTGADPLLDAGITVEEEHIISVGSWSKSSDSTVLDFEGVTLLPGLIDAHTHLGLAVEVNKLGHSSEFSVAELAARVFENCNLALDAGFTTCRELGGLDGGVAEAINVGLVRGPRIFPSGPAIAQEGGHLTMMPSFAQCYCPLSVPGLSKFTAVANGATEVRLAARRAFLAGATQLKLMVSGGVVSLSDAIDDTQLTVEEIRAAVDEAEARDTYVTVHSHNIRGIQNALAAGAKCVEHGTYLDEPTAQAMAASGAALIPTLSVVHLMREHWRSWGLPEDAAARVAGVEEGMHSAIELAKTAGVLVGSGSDLLGPGQNHRGLELALRARLGSTMDAIVAATSTNAKLMRVDHILGTIEPGKLADIVGIAGDPFVDPAIFDDPTKVVFVMKAGKVMKNIWS